MSDSRVSERMTCSARVWAGCFARRNVQRRFREGARGRDSRRSPDRAGSCLATLDGSSPRGGARRSRCACRRWSRWRSRRRCRDRRIETTTLRSSPAPAPVAVAAGVVHDTVNVVRFVFVGEAKTVSLVGDFNAWGARPVPLTTTGANGAWTVSRPARQRTSRIRVHRRWKALGGGPVCAGELR